MENGGFAGGFNHHGHHGNHGHHHNGHIVIDAGNVINNVHIGMHNNHNNIHRRRGSSSSSSDGGRNIHVHHHHYGRNRGPPLTEAQLRAGIMRTKKIIMVSGLLGAGMSIGNIIFNAT
jgi:hypothetical protein